MSVFKIKPSPLTASTREFIIPPTILSDYENYLMTEVPNAVFDFELLHSWYDRDADDYEKYMMRAEYFPINWKSKVGNSDMSYNFYCDTHHDVRKGDIAIREDGRIYMFNWNIQMYINAQTTQAIECNNMLEVIRHVPMTADRRGYVIEPEHDETIVDNIPCVFSEYAGRPDYQASQNQPGILADFLAMCEVQYNEKTKNIREEDRMRFGLFNYHVVHIDQTQVEYIDLDPRTTDEHREPHGILRMYLRKAAGEYT